MKRAHDEKQEENNIDDEVWNDINSSPAPSRSSTNNHSEIEKRRRDRMNTLITQLSALLPTVMKPKLDKLSVLRLTIQHIHSICSSSDKELDYTNNASHLSASEMLLLLQKSAESFIVVLDVSSGEILHASENSNGYFSQEEIEAKNWFELLHENDVEPFKRQMLYFISEEKLSICNQSNDNVSSSTTRYSRSNSDFRIGLKRSFICRLKADLSSTMTSTYNKFRCYGFLRDTTSSLILLLLTNSNHEHYSGEKLFMKLSTQGRIIDCDKGLSSLLGFLSHQLIGQSYYDIVHEGDLIDVAQYHKQVIEANSLHGLMYRLRRNADKCVMVDSIWEPFVNPWNQKIQFITVHHCFRDLRNDEEISIEESTLKQLLSDNKGPLPKATVLGAARFGTRLSEKNS